ncbi:chemotaxis protein CheW [Shewanella avicenniae]|uniref:Chemotaxis protein CheW n=1 Tax=Shewanella avicenniae TaxID=2814294 RepID=A0ABX7QPA9_9GAMM|nr:chemotaxis protein CheW [Shewanella avicenniae]QSX32700.1 chemotaxis protein CheW [Shewanella avicenniae]
MSKSVDQTVFDYFSLLLAEPDDVQREAAPEQVSSPIATAAPMAAKLSEATASVVVDMPAVESVDVAIAKPKLNVVEKQQPAAVVTPHIDVESKLARATLDKQALEKLLSSVVPEVATVAAAAEVKPKANIELAEKATLEVSPTVKVAEKIAENPTAAIIKEQRKAVDVEVTPVTQTAATPPALPPALDEQLDEEFQVLFFKVAGLTLAVPLISLGGIVQVEHINHIIGRPKWFLGVQQYRETQLNLVNTAAWVMPEKYDEKLAQSVKYQYLVVLENSNWGLACESLINAVKIDKSQVNWRGKAGKRPWLAGVVKEQMCGILHVQALIEMLNAGLGCQDPIN